MFPMLSGETPVSELYGRSSGKMHTTWVHLVSGLTSTAGVADKVLDRAHCAGNELKHAPMAQQHHLQFHVDCNELFKKVRYSQLEQT